MTKKMKEVKKQLINNKSYYDVFTLIKHIKDQEIRNGF